MDKVTSKKQATRDRPVRGPQEGQEGREKEKFPITSSVAGFVVAEHNRQRAFPLLRRPACPRKIEPVQTTSVQNRMSRTSKNPLPCRETRRGEESVCAEWCWF